jgi:hypothetical protein
MTTPTEPITPEDKVKYYKELVLDLVLQAETQGVIIRVERVSFEPLAMRRHCAYVEAWSKR